jgi:dihydrofolate reductase
MLISIIVAISTNRVIGANNQLLWHLSDDLKYFKKLTLGKPVVMGRKTFESIGRPLPDRSNWVISGNLHYIVPTGVMLCQSLAEAISALERKGEPEVMVIGGGQVYRAALVLAQRVYLTEVAVDLPGDVFFPVLASHQWRVVSRVAHPRDEKHPYDFSWVTFERVKNSVTT